MKTVFLDVSMIVTILYEPIFKMESFSMNKFLAMFVAMSFAFVGVGAIQSCGENKDIEETVTTGNIFLRVVYAQSSLPTCNSSVEGLAVYVEADSIFKYCKNSSWTNLNLSAGTSKSLLDGNGNTIGPVLFGNLNRAQVLTGDGGILTVKLSTGKFSSGFCDASANGCISLSTLSHSVQELAQCWYVAADCTGSCLSPGAPIKNMVYSTNGGYVIASGSETASTSVTVGSYWDAHAQSCVPESFFMGNGWPVTTSYTLPTGVPSYPFATPLRFQ